MWLERWSKQGEEIWGQKLMSYTLLENDWEYMEYDLTCLYIIVK